MVSTKITLSFAVEITEVKLGLPVEEKCFHCEAIVNDDFCTVCEKDYMFKV